jgi:hypothetical protein
MVRVAIMRVDGNNVNRLDAVWPTREVYGISRDKEKPPTVP